MVASAKIDLEIHEYLRRLDLLFNDVQTWVDTRLPGATYTRYPVQLDEESTGQYSAQAMEVQLPGMLPLRFLPRGIFMIGARGRVDLRTSLGEEVLVWIVPVLAADEFPGRNIQMIDRITQPVYPDTVEGWAWADESQNRLVHLTEQVFWDELIPRLSE